MSFQDDDPFAGGVKTPSVSFKGAPIGAKVEMRITAKPELVQSRDFETGKPATWDDGNPKMSAVVKGTVNGEERAFWAQKPSSLFAAIAKAQETAGARLAPGGTLVVTLVGEKPNDNPRLAPQKLYEATYSPADAFSVAASESSAPTADEPAWSATATGSSNAGGLAARLASQ